MARQEQNKKRSVSLGILFWIATILLIIVIFLFNRKNIEQVVESTGLIEVINQQIGMDHEDQDNPPENPDQNTQTPDVDGSQNSQETPNDGGGDVNTDSTETNSITTIESPSSENDTNQSEDNSNNQTNNETENSADTQNTNTSQQTQSSNTETSEANGSKIREYLLYMVSLDSQGNASVQPVATQIHFESSPLTMTLKALFEKPYNDGDYLNLIPTGSRINRIWIEEGTAFIDVNENFRFNPMGLQGHRLQLAQLVLTATQFPTVNAVQILIDGKTVDYLGGDGTYIGSALSPADVQ